MTKKKSAAHAERVQNRVKSKMSPAGNVNVASKRGISRRHNPGAVKGPIKKKVEGYYFGKS